MRRSLAGLRAVMADLGMLPRRTVELGPEPVLCSGSRWLYTDRGGLLQVLPELAEHVEADQPIANLHSVFGDLEAVYRTPEAGVVIGKAVDPIAETGARLLHLGRIARPDDPLFPRGILETGPEESV